MVLCSFFFGHSVVVAVSATTAPSRSNHLFGDLLQRMFGVLAILNRSSHYHY